MFVLPHSNNISISNFENFGQGIVSQTKRQSWALKIIAQFPSSYNHIPFSGMSIFLLKFTDDNNTGTHQKFQYDTIFHFKNGNNTNLQIILARLKVSNL